MDTRDATSAPDAALTISGLTVRIRTDAGVLEALSDVSLSIGSGQSVGLVGESGSGKSLLCKAIMGLLPRQFSVEGSVVLNGRETVGLRAKERRQLWAGVFGMIFQDPRTALSPVKRIGDQLTYPLRHQFGLDRKEARARSVELLRAVGIPDPTRRIDQYPHELSGGMQQRVMIALALSLSPDFLFADEPTTALDVTVQAQVLDLLARQRDERGSALVLCSHDLHVVVGRTDVVIVMYAGQVVEVAPSQELYRTPHMPYTEALLRALPQLEQPSHTRLRSIPGRPPMIADRPRGCRFAPRCAYATEKCVEEMPPLETTAAGRSFRCWFPRNVDELEVEPGPPVEVAALIDGTGTAGRVQG